MDPDATVEGPSRKTRSKTQRNINGTVYSESTGFSPGILPTKKDIIESMIYLLRPDRAGKNGRTVEVISGQGISTNASASSEDFDRAVKTLKN